MRKGKGWSLLELLTVIAIIAILVAILFPVFSRAKEAAKKATCLSNISQLAKAMRLYSLDYSTYTFFGGGRPGDPNLQYGGYGEGYYLKKIMKNYVPDWGIWFCPSDKYAKKDFTCNTNTFGCFNYTPVSAAQYIAFGYSGLPSGYIVIGAPVGTSTHNLDTDRGIIRLYSELIRLYGTDDMKMEHNEMSYRYYGVGQGGLLTDIDVSYRNFSAGRGAYGYWDVQPSNNDLFQEDMCFHFGGTSGYFGGMIYGKNISYVDGHSHFITYEPHGGMGSINYGEQNEPY